VSEQILNGTSAHIGYTVPFTSVYAGKYRQKTVKTKTKHNPEKANNKTQPNKTSLVQSTFMTLGQETRWAPEITRGTTYFYCVRCDRC